jgi:hypothetical protein
VRKFHLEGNLSSVWLAEATAQQSSSGTSLARRPDPVEPMQHQPVFFLVRSVSETAQIQRTCREGAWLCIILQQRQETMLTPKQYQDAFNMALQEFKNHPHVALSEGLNPYSPGSDECRAWNDGWVYARNFYICTIKKPNDQVDRGVSFQPNDLQ